MILVPHMILSSDTLLPKTGADFQLWSRWIAAKNKGPFTILNYNRHITLGEEWIHAPTDSNR